MWRNNYTRADHLIPGLIFFRGSYNTQRSDNKAGHVATRCKCTCITGSRYLPTFALWKPLIERLPVVCVAFHDGGESSVVCVHQFLFVSGGNWY
jgi:hypothetical protein